MLLPKFSSSLVELLLESDYTEVEKNLPANLSFPKLEVLWTTSISVSFSTKILKDANKLQLLSIELSNPKEINEEFFEMLLKKKTLKKLIVKNDRGDILSFDSFRKPEFKLTLLAIDDSNYGFEIHPDVLYRNFKAFVLAMADTLTTLDIWHFRAEDALLIQNLPALKTLKIGEHQDDRSLASYKPNTSIEVLGFASIVSTPPAFLNSLKSVRSMSVWCIDKDDLKKILRSLPGLLKLKLGSHWGMKKEALENIYKEVRSVEPTSVESLEVEVGTVTSFVLKL
jgi:hypothetical protein